MRRTGLLVVVAALALAASCARAATSVTAPTAQPNAATSSAPPAAGATSDRTAAIYAATLRRFLTTADSSAGQPQRWARAYVLTRPQARPAYADGTLPPIPATVQRAVTDALRDVLEVIWVTDRTSVLPRQGCPRLRDGAILVTLGSVPEAGDRVEIPVFGLVACLNASGLTYILQRSASGWQVTGTTGPYVIA